MLTRISTVLAVVVLSVTLATGVAIADVSPAEQAYSGQAGDVQTPSNDVAAVQAAAVSDDTSGGSLPFTGADLRNALLIGIVLLGAGLLVRRGASSPRGS